MHTLLSWDRNTLSVHVASMDQQHEHLIGLMNHLYDRHKSSAPREEVGKILKTLGDATVKHFASEEAYMDSIHYPELGKHKSIHHNLLMQLGQHVEQFKTTGVLEEDFFVFLRLWLSAHIKGIDRKYGEFASK